MRFNLSRFFKRKNCNLDLISIEECAKKGLITEEEMLRIKKDRAEKKLIDYLLKNKKK